MASKVTQPTRSLPTILESICRERRKEKLDKLNEDGFVVLAIESFWTRLFSQYFIDSHDETRDDMLFFVKAKNGLKEGEKEGNSEQSKIVVYRRDSQALPSLGDPVIDWEETVYLNLILQQFEYTLTCAVCTKPHDKELRILKRVSQHVYASPSRRRMDGKGETVEISYPNLFFHLDNFEELFADFVLTENEMVCVELVARDKTECVQSVIFLGSIQFEALKRVYDGKTNVATKMAQKMSLGWWRGPANVEFIKMKGPGGKGHAEMAICRQKDPEDDRPCEACGWGNSAQYAAEQPGRCQCDVEERFDRTRPNDYSSSSARRKKGNVGKWTKFRRKSLGGHALSAYLTYVTIPWNKIMKDILEVRQPPILL